jgi:hypothetical protein
MKMRTEPRLLFATGAAQLTDSGSICGRYVMNSSFATSEFVRLEHCRHHWDGRIRGHRTGPFALS